MVFVCFCVSFCLSIGATQVFRCGYPSDGGVEIEIYVMSFMCEHRRVWTVQYELPLFDARVIKDESHGSFKTIDMDENVLVQGVCKKNTGNVDRYVLSSKSVDIPVSIPALRCTTEINLAHLHRVHAIQGGAPFACSQIGFLWKNMEKRIFHEIVSRRLEIKIQKWMEPVLRDEGVAIDETGPRSEYRKIMKSAIIICNPGNTRI